MKRKYYHIEIRICVAILLEVINESEQIIGEKNILNVEHLVIDLKQFAVGVKNFEEVG